MAEMAFLKLLDEMPNSQYADNCQYWIGECNYAKGNYAQAIVEFEKVFAFDTPDKKDDAQIMLALSQRNIGKTDNAESTFSWLIYFYPESEYLNRAEQYRNELMF